MQQKISQAKARLLVNYPYFGTVASKIELIQNNDIASFKSDGKKVEYNGDFFEKLNLNEVEFILANGAMHASLSHEQRKNGRSGWLWQMATDFAVNDMLVENGLEMPEGTQYRKRFCGMYAEEIYAELKDDILRDELEYEADNFDDVQTESQDKNMPQERSMEAQLFEEFTKSVLETEEKKGELPLSMERFFNLRKSSKIDWRNELKVAIDRFHKDDYILIPPNKKFLYLGIYLPSSVSNKFQLVIAVDSSGSVNEKLLGEFLGEVEFLMSSVQNFQIDLLTCDDKIRSHQVFYSGDKLEADLKGGGATNFRPVFEFVEQELKDTKLLLYFTDLEGIFPKEVPNYDVKWVTPKEQIVPFGEIIILEN